jgi:hypothetical protein
VGEGGRSRLADGDASAALVGRICLACVRSLPVSGAAVSVMTAGGHRGVVFASDEVARLLEDVQFMVGDGPGVDAFTSGRAVLVPDLGGASLRSARAWPGFREAARDLGVRAVFAFPLQLGAASLGALTVYRLDSGALDGPHLATAVRLADAAAVAVLDLIVGTVADGAELSDADPSGAGDAEFYRSEIYQAAGMVMVQLGVSIEVAMIRLRSHAFATGRRTGEVAREIVGRRLRLEADTG